MRKLAEFAHRDIDLKHFQQEFFGKEQQRVRSVGIGEILFLVGLGSLLPTLPTMRGLKVFIFDRCKEGSVRSTVLGTPVVS